MPQIAQAGQGGAGALGGKVRVAAQMKGRGGGESLKARVNYCSAYSALFMWGEGLV